MRTVEKLRATKARVPERPTIAELEAILSAPDAPQVEIMPDGQIKEAEALVNPDGPEAAALIELYEEALERIASGIVRIPGARPAKMTTFRMSSIAKAALAKAHHPEEVLK
jgi:hypothetical protein